MTGDDANRLLDSVKDGAVYPQEIVSKALSATGDHNDYIFVICPEIEDFVQALREGGSI